MKEKQSKKLIQRGQRSPELGGGGYSKDTKRHQRSMGRGQQMTLRSHLCHRLPSPWAFSIEAGQ